MELGEHVVPESGKAHCQPHSDHLIFPGEETVSIFAVMSGMFMMPSFPLLLLHCGLGLLKSDAVVLLLRQLVSLLCMSVGFLIFLNIAV